MPPLSLMAISLIIGLACFLVPLVPFRVAGQALLVIIIVRAFCYWPPIVRWFITMPWPHRTVFLLLIFGIVAGHFTLQTHRFFPFVAWEIFGQQREENPVRCREFIATTASGKQTRLLVEQLFPSIVQFNPPADNDGPAMIHLVTAMARAYNRAHPADPVRAVDLVRVSVDLHPAAPPSCDSLQHFAVSSDRSN